MENNKNYLQLKKLCQDLGIDLFGVADIKPVKGNFKLSEKLLAKLDKAVCLGLRVSQSVLDEITSAPTFLGAYNASVKRCDPSNLLSFMKENNFIESDTAIRAKTTKQ